MRCEYLKDDGTTCLLARVTGHLNCPGPQQYALCEEVRVEARQVLSEPMRCEYLSGDGTACLLACASGYTDCPGSQQYDLCEEVRVEARQELIRRQIRELEKVFKNRK